MPSDVDHWLHRTNAELARLGRVPRVLSAALTAVGVPIGIVGWLNSGSAVIPVIVAGIPAAIFLLSLMVRARVTPDALIVRSYLGSQTIRFEDVLVFIDSAYSGAWNRSAGSDGWMNLGTRMIDVERLNGRGSTLRATISPRRTCARIVALLNERLEALGAGDPQEAGPREQ